LSGYFSFFPHTGIVTFSGNTLLFFEHILHPVHGQGMEEGESISAPTAPLRWMFAGMAQMLASLAVLHIHAGLYLSDQANALLCKAIAFAWNFVNLVFAYSISIGGATFCEESFLGFVILPLYAYIGVYGPVGPLTPNRALLVHGVFVLWIWALFSSFLSYFPDIPFVSGDPFTKFGFPFPLTDTLTWAQKGFLAIVNQSYLFMALYLGCFAFFLGPREHIIGCRAMAFNWLIFTIQEWIMLGTGHIVFTELPILCPLMVVLYLYLGEFIGPKTDDSVGALALR